MNEFQTAVLDRLDIKLHPLQAAILEDDYRFKLITGGGQGGKSYVAAAEFILRMFRDMAERWTDDEINRERLLYWLVGADYDATEREFTYIGDHLTALFGEKSVNTSKRVDPGLITMSLALAPGTAPKEILRIETKSAKDPRKIRKDAPHGIVNCEASQLDFTTWERLRGRAADRRAWMISGGTLESSLGWYPALADLWRSGYADRKSYELPKWANLTLYPEGRNDPEILALEAESSDEYFMERVAGKRVPPRGVVFGKHVSPDIHVQPIEYVPGIPVTITVDPGAGSPHSVMAVQEVGGVVQFFDEIYEQMITEDIIEIVRSKPWWPAITEGVIDQYGWQRHAQTPPAMLWQAPPTEDGGGIGLYMNSVRIENINDADNRLKSFLRPHPITKKPLVIFSPRCKGFLSEVGMIPSPLTAQTLVYRHKTDRDGNIIGTKPENENNHSIRAIEFYLVFKHGWAYVDKQETMTVHNRQNRKGRGRRKTRRRDVVSVR